MVPDLLAIASLAATLPLSAYWGIGAARIVSGHARFPGVACESRGRRPSPPSDVLVVIAAHEESARLPGLVRDLLAQDMPGLSFRIALDRCTDGSAELLRGMVGDDPRWTVVEVDDCPPGWASKVHAIDRAIAANPPREGLLLFLDADVRLEPRVIRAAAELIEAEGLDVLSLLPRLCAEGPMQSISLPVAAIELLHQYPPHRVNRAGRRRAFANGQFMLWRREAYDLVGGHAAVRDELLEDIALARLARDHGLRAQVRLAGALLRARAPASMAEAGIAWRRILGEACRRRTPRLVRGGWRVRTFGTILPLVALVSMALPVESPIGAASRIAACLSLAMYAAVVAASWRMAGAAVVASIGAPLGSWIVGGWMLAAARSLRRGEPTRWAGKAYARVPAGAAP